MLFILIKRTLLSTILLYKIKFIPNTKQTNRISTRSIFQCKLSYKIPICPNGRVAVGCYYKQCR